MSASDGFFVDSNVLLYCVDPGDIQKRKRAAEWMDALWQSGAGRLIWQVLRDTATKCMRRSAQSILSRATS
jgi:predicted nucleic acid-binding protein